MTLGTNVIWVNHQLTSDATAPLVDPQLAQLALDGVVANSTAADSTGILARFLEDTKANPWTRDLVFFFMLILSPWFFMPAFHALSLETIFQGIHDEHQVISLEELLCQTSTELLQKPCCSPTPHCVDHWPEHIHNSRHWCTSSEWRTQPIPWHRGSSRPTAGPSSYAIKGFLKVGKGKVEWFVGNLHLLQLAKMKMASVVPLPGTKPNCISSMFLVLESDFSPMP